MGEVASEFASAYNRRKHRMNAFWGDNYHATLVEEDEYLNVGFEGAIGSLRAKNGPENSS